MDVSAINQLIRTFDKKIFNYATTFMLTILFTIHITYPVTLTIAHFTFTILQIPAKLS